MKLEIKNVNQLSNIYNIHEEKKRGIWDFKEGNSNLKKNSLLGSNW